MGAIVEHNDTLRISKEQGFPAELDIKRHLQKPFTIDQFKDKVFEFSGKERIRIYKTPPIRNILVEDLGGKWLYWGLCHIVEIHHDYINQVTSGKFKIIRINSPEEMELAFELIDFDRPELNYFR